MGQAERDLNHRSHGETPWPSAGLRNAHLTPARQRAALRWRVRNAREQWLRKGRSCNPEEQTARKMSDAWWAGAHLSAAHDRPGKRRFSVTDASPKNGAGPLRDAEPDLRSGHPQRGFTLLELILALGLTTVLLTIVGMAIHLYLGTVDGCRTGVRQAELARNLLQQIASDLHNAVPYAEPEAGGGGGGDAALEDMGDGEEEDAGETSDEEVGEDEEVVTVVDTLEPPAVPGVYGNQYELQIDVGRLPRIDQMERLMAMQDPQLIHRCSDITTIGYYVGQIGVGTESTAATAADGSGYGLVRRSLDRAVAQWAAESGGQFLMADADQLIAPEVIAIEFRYFDGIEWVTSWDSAASGGLPLAVEIALMMAPSDQDQGLAASTTLGQLPALISTTGTATSGDEDSIYRLVVQLPTAKAAMTDTTTTGGF